MQIISIFEQCPIWKKDPHCAICPFFVPIPIQDRLFNEWAYYGATWGDAFDEVLLQEGM